MRFPSLAAIGQRARTVATRFPVVLLAGVVAAVTAIIGSRAHADDAIGRLAFVAALGIPLALALRLTAERRRWSPGVRTGVAVAAVAALALFWLGWPGMDQKHGAIQYLQLSATLHLAVAVLPWLGGAEGAGFWQYNRRLFLSILRSGVFSAVLWIGLAIALAALDRLFGVDMPDRIYLDMFFVVAFVVNTWIFLDGVPDDLDALAQDTDYPRALKVFTQYILTPLVAVYLLLLLAYLVKVLVTGTWPSGWIGYLVASVSVAGLLGFLLVHPLREREGEGWITLYGRFLFIGLVPAALMFLMALGKRVGAYGLTELRYVGLLLGGWMLVMALLYALRQGRGIRLIPLSLGALLLVTLFGPLAAVPRSVASQRGRLAREMRAARTATDAAVRDSAALRAAGPLRYLLEHRAYGDINAALDTTLPQLAAVPDTLRWREDSLAEEVFSAVGLEYRVTPAQMDGRGFFSSTTEDALPVAGYDWVLQVGARDTTPVPLAGDTLRLEHDTVGSVLHVWHAGARVLTFDLAMLTDSIRAPYVPSSRGSRPPLALEASGAGWRGRLLVRHAGWEDRITGWGGTLLLDLPN